MGYSLSSDLLPCIIIPKLYIMYLAGMFRVLNKISCKIVKPHNNHAINMNFPLLNVLPCTSVAHFPYLSKNLKCFLLYVFELLRTLSSHSDDVWWSAQIIFSPPIIISTDFRPSFRPFLYSKYTKRNCNNVTLSLRLHKLPNIFSYLPQI